MIRFTSRTDHNIPVSGAGMLACASRTAYFLVISLLTV